MERLRALFLLLCLAFCCSGWLFRKTHQHDCQKPRQPGDKPYFFGKTNLVCMTYSFYFRRSRRSPPSLYTLQPLHSWIYYDGHFVEFGVYHNYRKPYNYSITTDHPAVGDKCSYKMIDAPQGYSSLDIDCIRGCAINYRKTYGKYNLFRNNCHVFVNRISRVLCYGKTCPAWCQT